MGTQRIAATPARVVGRNSPIRRLEHQGKLGGRTFGVQSLREVTRCALASRWAGSEVLLSRLPKSNLDYTNGGYPGVSPLAVRLLKALRRSCTSR